jgi:MFS family permease
VRLPRQLSALVGGLPSTFWYLWAGVVVNRVTGFIVPFIALWLTRDGEFTAARAGLVVSLYGLGAIFSTLAGGALSDRVGRRFTILLGLLGSAASVLAIAALPVRAMPPFVLLAGFFGELYRPPIFACVADLVAPEHRARAYSLTYWGVNVGWAAGGLIAGTLASISYTLLFVGDAVTTLLFAVIVALRIPETRPAEAATSTGAAAHPVREMLSGIVDTFGDRHFAAFLALEMLIFLVFMQIQVALPLDMAAKGIGTAGFGALISVNGLLIAVVQPLAGPALSRRDPGLLLALSAVLVGAGFGLHGLAQAPLGFAIAVAVWSLGEIGNFPVASTLVAELAPVHLRGRYQGAFAMVMSVAAFLAPMSGPFLLDRLGTHAFWGACFVVCAVAAAGHLAIAGPRRRHLAALRRAVQARYVAAAP